MSGKKINVTQTFLPPQEEYQTILDKVWESKWLTNRGELVCELEDKIQSHLDSSSKPLAVNNGTIALQIAVKALKLKGEIITTPFSYVATTSSVVWENCIPIFVDIDENTLNIDADKIEDAITDKTSAILAVHVYGNPCEIEKIESIAQRHQLSVIYDAAHCFGSKYKNQSLFNFGDISTTSFHATKLFHTGEGGAIFCNNEELAKTIYDQHNFGHDGPEKFFGLGINAKLSELNAAMGLAILPYMESVIRERETICSLYDALLNWGQLKKPVLREDTTYNYSYYPVVFQNEAQLLRVKNALEEKNIFPRRYFYPSLNKLPYINYQAMPISESISSRVLCLPLFVGLSEENVNLISETINKNL